jgi:hypothetical protein
MKRRRRRTTTKMSKRVLVMIPLMMRMHMKKKTYNKTIGGRIRELLNDANYF